MKKVKTFQATIYCGLKHRESGLLSPLQLARNVCQNVVNEYGWCVSFTKTEFIYTEGKEPGVIIGIINYPRFPMEPEELKRRTLDLAETLMTILQQLKVSVVFSDETIMLEAGEDKERKPK